MNLKNKTALVTGASSGIGKETALLLAENGATVFAIARREQQLQELAKQNPNIIAVKQDVTENLSALQQALGDKSVDILVNNAGLAWGLEKIQDAPREKWDRMIDVNIKSLIAVTQFILPRMIQAKSGDIVNIGSIAGHEFYGGGSAYCATKAAVTALTKSWRQDLLGTGVRAMGIHPGATETEFSLVRFDGDQKRADQVYQGMQPLTGKDIAETILWVVSRPRHVSIESVIIYPTAQSSPWVTHREN